LRKIVFNELLQALVFNELLQALVWLSCEYQERLLDLTMQAVGGRPKHLAFIMIDSL